MSNRDEITDIELQALTHESIELFHSQKRCTESINDSITQRDSAINELNLRVKDVENQNRKMQSDIDELKTLIEKMKKAIT